MLFRKMMVCDVYVVIYDIFRVSLVYNDRICFFPVFVDKYIEMIVVYLFNVFQLAKFTVFFHNVSDEFGNR